MSPQASLTLPCGTEIPLGISCTMGRSSSNQLVLEHESVSRRHAFIHQQGEAGHWLLDLGSSNGTQVNNRPVAKPVLLHHLDEIRIGSVRLIFQTATSGEKSATLVGSTMLNMSVNKQWLMIADIEGYTPMSQALPPAELAKHVGSWFAQTRTRVERAGGHIHRYLGDGWLAGWPDEVGADRRVAHCLEALDELKQHSPTPFRLALHFGDVASSGSIASTDLGMMGPDLNFLFRMEKIGASIGETCILSQAASDRIAAHRPCRAVGTHAVKGFGDAHTFYA